LKTTNISGPFSQARSQEGARGRGLPGTVRPPPELSSLEKKLFVLTLVFLFHPPIYFVALGLLVLDFDFDRVKCVMAMWKFIKYYRELIA